MLISSLLFLLYSQSIWAFPALHWAGRLIANFEEIPLIDDGPSLLEETVSSKRLKHHADSDPLVSLIYQFSDDLGVKLENLAARGNGHLVLTSSSNNTVWDIDPQQSHPQPKLVATFPGTTGNTGIIETTPDVFVVCTGNWSTQTFTGTPGSFAVWSVDLSSGQPKQSLITTIPEAGGLNGITRLHGSDTVVLIVDSDLGAIFKLDTTTGEYNITIQHPYFERVDKKPLGINGVHNAEGLLYFSNSAQALYGSVLLNDDGTAAGEVSIIARAGPEVFSFDDLITDWEGNGWISTHENVITEITAEGKQRNFTGTDDIPLLGPTSNVWGRGSVQEQNTLYIVTVGLDSHYKAFGSQVLALDTCLIV